MAAQRQIIEKIHARLNTIIFFVPPYSNPPKPSVGNLTLDLYMRYPRLDWAPVAMAPLRASGRQRHLAAEVMHSKIEHGDVVTMIRVPVSDSTYIGYHNILRQVPIRLMDFTME